MTEKLKLGELFAGFGGLGMAVEEVFDAELTWYAEFDDAPSKIMAHHWPDVPNHRDVTTIQWLPECPNGGTHKVEVFRVGSNADPTAETYYGCTECGWELPVEDRPAQVPYPVDIISGGSPCQDLSAAGRRAGMTEGTRSNLWVSMREAIAVIKPTYVVWENVRGAYSAKASSASDLEPGDGSMGARAGNNLRALGRVLGDLADLGYDCQWRGLRAADVGAPHSRYRVFILATRRDATNTLSERSRESLGGQARIKGAEVPQPHHRGTPTTDSNNLGSDGRWERTEQNRRGQSANSSDAPADTGGSAKREHPGEPPAEKAGPTGNYRSGDPSGERSTGNGRETPADTKGRRRGNAHPDDLGSACGKIDPPGHDSDAASRAFGASTYGKPASNAAGYGRDQRGTESEGIQGRHDVAQRSASLGTNWGVYAQAIRRWEALRGTAPAPTDLTPKGKHRLSSTFAEWMMGLDRGHVTGVTGLTRNEELKALGNGVVRQQAVAALNDMLSK